MSLVPAASGYPSNLAFLARRLSNFSRQTIKLNPLNLTSATSTSSAGTPISVMLPSNTILDLDTFSMYFQGTTLGVGGAACFPKNIESIIRNLNVQCADRTIDNIQEYNRIWNIVLDHTSGVDSDTKRAIMSNGGTWVQDKIKPGAGQTGGTYAIANETNVRYAINSWLGFLGHSTPRMLDASLFNPLKVTIELATSFVLCWATGATSASYTLSDIYFTVDVVNVMDSMLSAMYQKMLSSSPDAYLEVPFPRWSTFSSVGGAAGTTVFNVSSQSLDMCIATFSPQVSQTLAYTDANGANTCHALGTSAYFIRPSSYAKSTTTFEVTDWQYSIGGMNQPAWNVTNDITLSNNLDQLQINRDLLGGVTPSLTRGVDSALLLAPAAPRYPVTPLNQAYMSAYASFIIRLNNNEEKGWISGLNTSGNVLYSTFRWNGTGTAQLQNFVFCKSTSSFIIKMGRQCDVVL